MLGGRDELRWCARRAAVVRWSVGQQATSRVECSWGSGDAHTLTGIDEKLIRQILRPLALQSVMKFSTLGARPVPLAALRSCVVRRKMKSDTWKRLGKSCGSTKMPSMKGITTGTLSFLSVVHVEAPRRPYLRRIIGSPSSVIDLRPCGGGVDEGGESRRLDGGA